MDAESYERFEIGGNTVTERGTISPHADGAQHEQILAGTTAIQDEGAMHMSIGSDNKADAHIQIVILSLEQRVGGEQGLGWCNASAFRQCERLGYGRKLGDVRRGAAEFLF